MGVVNEKSTFETQQISSKSFNVNCIPNATNKTIGYR